MRQRTTWCLALLLTGTLLGTTWAQEEARRPPGSQPARQGGPGATGTRGAAPAVPQSLGSAMRDMDRALKAIKAAVADVSKNEQTIKDIATLERDVAIAKASLPPIVNRMAGDAKIEGTSNYRSMMVSLMRSLLDLEDAVADKKPDLIKKAIADIDNLETEGHKEFNPPRNRSGAPAGGMGGEGAPRGGAPRGN